jgi:hypothetical protein
VRIDSELGGEKFARTLELDSGSPYLRVSTRGVASNRTTVTCRFEGNLAPQVLAMDTVGGEIERPRERQFSPTFWAVPSRLTLDDGRALHALFETPTAIALSKGGALEWIVARNAPRERAFGWLPVLAHPIGGTNPEHQVHHAALMGRGELREAQRTLALAWLPEAHRAASEHVEALVACDSAAVSVRAVKRSGPSDDVTVRLYREQPLHGPVRVWLPEHEVESAWSCDALGRPLDQLEVVDGRVLVEMSSRLMSVRLTRAA